MTHHRHDGGTGHHRGSAAQQDSDHWDNNNGGGIDNAGAQQFFLGYHNEHTAVSAAMEHLKKDFNGNNPSALKQDLQALADASQNVGDHGNKSWRQRFLNDLQDQMNANNDNSKALRKALGYADTDKVDFKDGKLQIPPAPYDSHNDRAENFPGRRDGDQVLSQPKQARDGHIDSAGLAQDANGKPVYYTQQDRVQNGVQESQRTYQGQPVDLSRGGQVIKGVTSETTTRYGDKSEDVVLHTGNGDVRYHQTPDGKISFGSNPQSANSEVGSTAAGVALTAVGTIEGGVKGATKPFTWIGQNISDAYNKGDGVAALKAAGEIVTLPVTVPAMTIWGAGQGALHFGWDTLKHAGNAISDIWHEVDQ